MPQARRWQTGALVALVAAVVAAAVSSATTMVLIDARPETPVPSPATTVVAAAPTVTVTVQASLPAAGSGDFAHVYQQVAGGIVRIETTACGEGGVGTGFLVGEDLVATVAHVVAGAHNVVLTVGETSVPGEVIGVDAQHEVALVRAQRPLSGYVFTLAAQEPPVGTDVLAIGFPLAGPIAPTRGTVSGLDRTMTTPGGETLDGLVQVDAPVNPGNSGGPLLTREGVVMGLVEARASDGQGIGFAVPATTAGPLLTGWRTAPAPPPPPGDCAQPVGPSQVRAEVRDDSGSADGPAVADLLTRYMTGINTGRFADAYAMFSPALQAGATLDQFTAGERSSHLFDVVVRSATRSTTGSVTAEVTFGSVQDVRYGHDGQSCSQWRITYQLVPGPAGGLLIDHAVPAPGVPASC